MPYIEGRIKKRKEHTRAFGGVTNAFATVKGRKFGSWIDADSRDNGYDEDDLVDNPAYVFESILRDVLGLTTAEIDIESMDAVGNTADGTRDGWLAARSITEVEFSLDTIQRLMQEFGCVMVTDSEGRYRIRALQNETPSITLDNGDIEEVDGRPMVRAKLSPEEDISNEFFLNYKLNYATGKYDKQLFITAADDNLSDGTRSNADGNGATYQALCTQSQSLYNIVRRWEYNADFIRDDATAELLIKHKANWSALRRWIVKSRVWVNSTTRKLEKADPLYWNISLLPAAVNETRTFFVSRIIDGGMRDENRARFDIETEMIPQVI